MENNKLISDLTEEEKKLVSKRKKKEKQKIRNQKKALNKRLKSQPLPRKERLMIAKKWLDEYDPIMQGKNIIKKYRKHFHIESMCAFKEIQLLEYPLTEEQIRIFKEAERNKMIQKQNYKRNKKKTKENNLQHMFPDSDDNFFMIIGYTSGGAPYGLTWEELGVEPYTNPYFEDEN